MVQGTGPAAAGGEAKEKKRALPSEFERQVEQIRNDIKTVRANLDAAERVLQESEMKANAGPSSAAGASGAMPSSTMQHTGTTAQPMIPGHVMQGNLMSEGVLSENVLGGNLMGGNLMHGDVLGGDLMTNE